MKYFYDTEFLEDGRTVELISIGIVAEDGREYYAVSSQMPWMKIVQHDWLMKNVVPSLPLNKAWTSPLLDRNDPSVKSRLQIRQEITTFFLLGDDPPELWAWYGAYDHLCLAQLYGRMFDMPKFVPMWTNDLRQEVERLDCYSELPEQHAGMHNALEDARWNREIHEFLRTHERCRNWDE